MTDDAQFRPPQESGFESAITRGTRTKRKTIMNWNSTNTPVVGTIRVLTRLLLAIQMVLTVSGDEQTQGEKQPDPFGLLKTVAQARQKITSGEMAFEVVRVDFGHPLEGTNHTTLKVVFDGEKRRFESFTREYPSVLMGPDAGEATDAKLRELGLVRGEAAVEAGLLRRVERNRVTAYDGVVLLDLSDLSATEKKFFQTAIDDSAKGGRGGYVFDPRVLGLTPSPFVKQGIESCLAYSHAESVELLGKEPVEGVAAWHVRVAFPKSRVNYDFWIDASNPSRVVKCQFNGNTALSKFDAANPEDPIPIEVKTVNFFGSQRGRVEESFLRRKTRYNVPVDPASWTLAGLNMPVGTEVIDYRISRQIGYWNGTGLSEDLPPTTAQPTAKSQSPPSPDKLLALAEKDPQSPFALESATWIILNTPDGPQVEKAANLIRRDHNRSTNLIYLCEGLERLRHHSAMQLLRSIVEENPNAAVQAHACFALATMLKGEANEAGDNQAAGEAAGLFDRVVADYGQGVGSGTKELADRAKSEVFELRRLGVGKVAPEIEGEDLEGRKRKLSDYRGKVVVLNFWGVWCGACMAMVPEERKLVERMARKPFALVGVNSDEDQAKVKRVMEKEKMTWPSFRDGAQGPISKAWNVESWPTVYVLDRKGVIRYRNVRGQALDQAVERLVGEGD
jgi:thiol-disulfide isomerase/thioredoxin